MHGLETMTLKVQIKKKGGYTVWQKPRVYGNTNLRASVSLATC